jgi:hypothetical protein
MLEIFSILFLSKILTPQFKRIKIFQFKELAVKQFDFINIKGKKFAIASKENVFGFKRRMVSRDSFKANVSFRSALSNPFATRHMWRMAV